MKKKIYSLLLGAAIMLLFAVPIVMFAQTQITANIPGKNSPATEGPGAFVANFYEFALMIGGVMAFGIIVYGGVKYMTSVGNPSGQSDAKEWIEAALLGLLLLVGAYFILNVINPQLLNLKLPPLTAINITAPTPTSPAAPGAPPSSQPATGCAGSGCQNLASAGLTCKPASQQPNGQASCSAAPGMVATLQCIQNKVGSGYFTVTEAMPPTVVHESSCHQNGCCVDTTVNTHTCAQVQALMNAVHACGATAANEYAGCSGSTIYPTTQGGNVHINSLHTGGC